MTSGTTTGWALLPAEQVEQLPWEDLHGVPGVRARVMWRSGGSMAGLLLIEPGAAIPPHAHPSCHHHVHVVSGSVRIGGVVLDEGGYAHVPGGQPHGLEAVGSRECHLFYLYLDES